MNKSKCTSKEIAEFVYQVKMFDETVVYAPILKMSCLVDTSVEDIRCTVPVHELSERSREVIENGEVCMLQPAKSVHDMDNMVILPNHKCNFSCSYCYAAKGRSDAEIDIEKLNVALDWFLDENRIPEKDLFVFIVGGGEPTMSWNVVVEIIEKVARARKNRAGKISLAMTTNGSLITEERAQILAESGVMVNVSFEVLRDVQNKQRGMCDEVERGIETLQRAGAKFAIRATVSPLSVDRMSEMVDIVLRRFPHVKRLNLEAMLAGKGVYRSTDSLRSFLERFRDGFAEAQRDGRSKGLKVVSSTIMDMTTLKERFCGGDFCLTPLGDVSICRRFSSPNEKNFCQMVFGHVEDGRLIIEDEKYQRALRFSLDDRDRCRHCFLRWNCGGLCLSQQMMFPPDYYDVLCDFAREEGFEYLRGCAKSECNQQGVPALS